jgi:hypothetical protein
VEYVADIELVSRDIVFGDLLIKGLTGLANKRLVFNTLIEPRILAIDGISTRVHVTEDVGINLLSLP